METAKVRVKFGNLEVDYEGDQAFVHDGLFGLIADVVALSKQLPKASGRDIPPEAPGSADNGGFGSGSLTMSTIAAHLQPDGQQELIMCALAKLQIIDGKMKAEKPEILAEMKHATGYFKAAMTRNFARDLKRMIKGKKINEVSSEVYSLTASSRQELESKIAGIG
jgi:hypothetical protein